MAVTAHRDMDRPLGLSSRHGGGCASSVGAIEPNGSDAAIAGDHPAHGDTDRS
jgi:hypothetical protein